MDLNKMRQSLTKDLAATASGAGGNYDVFSQALSQELAAGYASVLGTPVAIPADQIDSDQPDPA